MKRIAAAGVTIGLLLGIATLTACGGGKGTTGGDKTAGPAGRQYAYQSGGDTSRDLSQGVLAVEADGHWAYMLWEQYGGVIGGQWRDVGDHLEFKQGDRSGSEFTARYLPDDGSISFDQAEDAAAILSGTTFAAVGGEPALKGDEAAGTYKISGGTTADYFPDGTVTLYEDGAWIIWSKHNPAEPFILVDNAGTWTRNGSDVEMLTGYPGRPPFADACVYENGTLTMTDDKAPDEPSLIWSK